MMKRSTRRGLLIALVLATGTYAIAEEVTLTTFYPSPRGVFEQLRIVGASLANSLELVMNDNAAASRARVSFQRSHGNASAPANSVSGDALGEMAFQGFFSGVYTTGGSIQAFLESAPAAADIPTYISFSTDPSGATALTERMRITSTGNLGIATTTPTTRLHVHRDNTVAAEDVVRFSSASNDPAGAARVVVDRARIIAGAPQPINIGDFLGEIDFRGRSPGGSTVTSGKISAVADGAPAAGDIPTALTFWTNPAGATTLGERMRISSAGNVGIGITAPAAQLHTSRQGTLAADESARFSSTSSDPLLGGAPRVVFERVRGTIAAPLPVANNDNLGEIQFRGRAPGGATVTSGKIAAVADGPPAAGDVPTALTFSTNPAGVGGLQQRMRISSAGNVAIGPNPPTAVASPGVDNLATGNLDVNDIWIRSAPPAGRWASQSTGGVLINRLDGGYSSRLFPGVGSVQVTTMQWVNCGFDNCPASGSGCALGPIGGTYIALLGTNPPGASCHAIQVDRPVDGNPGKAFMLSASCPPGWKVVSGGANSYKNASDQVPNNALVSVPDTYQSFLNIPEDAGWVYDINSAPLAGNPPGSTEGWTTAAPKTSGYDGLQAYVLCGGP